MGWDAFLWFAILKAAEVQHSPDHEDEQHEQHDGAGEHNLRVQVHALAEAGRPRPAPAGVHLRSVLGGGAGQVTPRRRGQILQKWTKH